MNMLKKLSVGAKLWLGVVFIVLGLGVVLTVVGMAGVRQLREAELAQQQMNKKILDANRWAALTELNTTRLLAAMLSADPAVDAMFKDTVVATTKDITAIQKQINDMPKGEREQALLGKIAEERKVVLSSLARARKMKDEGDNAGAAREISGDFSAAIKPYLADIHAFADLQTQLQVDVQQMAADARFTNLRNAAIMMLGLVALIAFGAHRVIQGIRQPLREAVEFSRSVAAGDLTARLDSTRHDEFHVLIDALSRMRDQLGAVVADVRSSTEQITGAAKEIASGNMDLSSRTEQAAASLQETAANMERMSETFRQSADDARSASQLAEVAGRSAEQGGQVVGQVVSTMAEIHAASGKISDIIAVIDGIAFQTNILALNAAVEAARAGEQGRGFAVVAGEVRTLAQRSAQAAKEIRDLITNSGSKVTQGSALVSQAGATMQEIVDNVVRVRGIIGQIASSAAEQADSTHQISVAVADLDRMTQQNAALVEQSAAAATSMREQAAHLSTVVNTFRLESGQRAQAPLALGHRA